MHALCQSVRSACRLRTASENAMRFLLSMLAVISSKNDKRNLFMDFSYLRYEMHALCQSVRSACRLRTASENAMRFLFLWLPSSAQKMINEIRSRIFHIYDMKCTHCAKACGALVGCARHPKMRCAFFFLCLPSSAKIV